MINIQIPKIEEQDTIACLEAKLWNLRNEIGIQVFDQEQGFGITKSKAYIAMDCAFVDVKFGKKVSITLSCKLDDLLIVPRSKVFFRPSAVFTATVSELQEIIIHFNPEILQELIDCCVETIEQLLPNAIIDEKPYPEYSLMSTDDVCLMEEWRWAKYSLEQILKINKRNPDTE